MDNFAPNFGHVRLRSNSLVKKCCLFLPLVLFLLFGLVGRGSEAWADSHDAPFASARPNLSFAIADFDGDLRPDIASVQTGRSDFSQTEYWIHLDFTAAERPPIEVVASIGGLQIAARDVNGDHAVDLVLTTALLRQPVAIFLNDGDGNFTRQAPSAFPGAFTEPEANWAPAGQQVTDAVGVPPQSRNGIFLETGGLPYSEPQAHFNTLLPESLTLCPFLTSQLSRAPPSQDPRP